MAEQTTSKRPFTQFCALTKAGLYHLVARSNFGIGKKRRAGMGALLLIGAVMLYMSGVYSYLFASMLAPVGGLDVMLLLITALGLIMTLLFTLLSAQSVLFSSRDTDLLFSLPVRPSLILWSKIAAVYLESLICTLFFLLPAGVVYLLYGGAGGAMFLCLFLLGGLFLPLIPTFFSLLVGYAVSALAGRMRHKRLALTLVSLVMMLGFVGALLYLSAGLNTLVANLAALRAFSAAYLYPLHLLTTSAIGGELLPLLGFAAISFAPLALAVWLLAPRYQAIVTRLNSHALKTDYRLTKVRGGGQWTALFKKEAGRYFGTPIYVFNTGFGMVLMLLAGGYLLFAKDGVSQFLSEFGLPASALLPALCAALSFFLSTCCTTCTSISLEGRRYLWILREAPVPPTRLFAVKIGLNLSLTLPVLLFITIALTLGLGLPFADGALLYLLMGAFSVFVAVFGLYLNLLLPRMDAANDTIVVKQSMSAFLGIFIPMLLALGLGALYAVILSPRLHFTAFGWAVTVLFVLVSLLVWQLTRTKGAKLFERLI